MGTKNRPGAYDCHEKAEPDEPLFTLLARDASAPALIEMWADAREKRGEEAGVVAEARECAEQMRAWRDHNRGPSPDPVQVLAAVLGAQGYGTRSAGNDAATVIDALQAAGWAIQRTTTP